MNNGNFENFLCEKNDEIDNAAYDLLNAIARATEGKDEDDSGKVVPWNMEIIGDLVDYAASLLSTHGYNTCHPFYEGEDRTPCPEGEDCDKASCPFQTLVTDSTTSEGPVVCGS